MYIKFSNEMVELIPPFVIVFDNDEERLNFAQNLTAMPAKIGVRKFGVFADDTDESYMDAFMDRV